MKICGSLQLLKGVINFRYLPSKATYKFECIPLKAAKEKYLLGFLGKGFQIFDQQSLVDNLTSILWHDFSQKSFN